MGFQLETVGPPNAPDREGKTSKWKGFFQLQPEDKSWQFAISLSLMMENSCWCDPRFPGALFLPQSSLRHHHNRPQIPKWAWNRPHMEKSMQETFSKRSRDSWSTWPEKDIKTRHSAERRDNLRRASQKGTRSEFPKALARQGAGEVRSSPPVLAGRRMFQGTTQRTWYMFLTLGGVEDQWLVQAWCS